MVLTIDIHSSYKAWYMVYKLRSVQNIGTCYPGQGWFVRNHFFYSSVGLFGNFAGLPVCTLPSAIVHCNQNEAGHQTIKAPSMPCWGAAGPSKHSGIYATDWWNWQTKWMKSVSMGSFQYTNRVSGESFAYLWVILLYFSLESWPDSSRVWEYVPSSLALK